jgi:hypothetical protein
VAGAGAGVDAVLCVVEAVPLVVAGALTSCVVARVGGCAASESVLAKNSMESRGAANLLHVLREFMGLSTP